MTKITYGKQTYGPFSLQVKVSGVGLVGHIRYSKTAGGFFYRTKSGQVGEVFKTVEEVKASIEAA